MAKRKGESVAPTVRRKRGLAVLVTVVACLLGIAAIYAYIVRTVTYVSPLQMATSQALRFEMILENLDDGNVDCARELVDLYLRSEVVLVESLLEREREAEARDRAKEVLARIARFEQLRSRENDAVPNPQQGSPDRASPCASESHPSLEGGGAR